MSEVKFTRGPWTTTGERLSIIDRRTYEIARVRESGYVDGISIVSGERLPDPFPLTQGIHNAHLIAAAPDLYGALLNARGFLDPSGEAFKMAGAALAKAQGESPPLCAGDGRVSEYDEAPIEKREPMSAEEYRQNLIALIERVKINEGIACPPERKKIKDHCYDTVLRLLRQHTVTG